jgi:hypothetical protein
MKKDKVVLYMFLTIIGGGSSLVHKLGNGKTLSKENTVLLKQKEVVYSVC